MKKLKYLSIVFLIVIIIQNSCSFEKNINIDDNNSEIPWKAYFIDVLKGDCIIIEIEKKFYMIDTGWVYTVPNVIKTLNLIDINEIEGIFITHTDKDHVGGLFPLIQSGIKINNIYTSNFIERNKNGISDVQKYANEYKINHKELKTGESIEINGMKFDILGPFIYDENENNNNSMVMRLSGKNSDSGSLLLMGDALLELEYQLMLTGNIFQSDVLKISHHGRDDATSIEFLKAVKPSISIISTNTQQAPNTLHLSVTEGIKQVGSELYVTQDCDIAILIESENKKLNVSENPFEDYSFSEINQNVFINQIDIENDYIELINEGESDVNISGWFIYASGSEKYFFFPNNTVIKPDEKIRVASGKTPIDGNFIWDTKKIWGNSDYNGGYLFDIYGNLLSEYI